MRLHTGSKPFKCPYCDLRFRTSGHRKTHIQFHFRASERHKSKRFSSSTCHSSQAEAGQAVAGQGQSPAAPDSLQPVGLLQTSSSDPNIYLPTNQVLTGQFDQTLLQPGLVGQTILPASMSGRFLVHHQSLQLAFIRALIKSDIFRSGHLKFLLLFAFLLKIALAFFYFSLWLQNGFDLPPCREKTAY